jgi:hypothetical protein
MCIKTLYGIRERRLALEIETGPGLVQRQELRHRIDGASESDPLPLTARQRLAGFADLRKPAADERSSRAPHELGGLHDLLVGRVLEPSCRRRASATWCASPMLG